VDAGIVEVLNVTGPKLFGLPFNGMSETVVPLMAIETVPVSTGGPLTLPLKLIVVVP